MPDTETIPTPSWIAIAIRGFPGASSNPTEHFIAAAADRVWQTAIAFAELQRSSDDEPLSLRLDMEDEGRAEPGAET